MILDFYPECFFPAGKTLKNKLQCLAFSNCGLQAGWQRHDADRSYDWALDFAPAWSYERILSLRGVAAQLGDYSIPEK